MNGVPNNQVNNKLFRQFIRRDFINRTNGNLIKNEIENILGGVFDFTLTVDFVYPKFLHEKLERVFEILTAKNIMNTEKILNKSIDMSLLSRYLIKKNQIHNG